MLAPDTVIRPAAFAAVASRPATTIDADGVVEGYASLFGEIDQARDMVMHGAFAATLRLRGIRRIPMLFQHDPSEPIGVWLELVEDLRGLRARGRLIPDVQRAREVLALVRAGAIDGLSIGFRTVRGHIDPRTRVRRLHQIDLWEISVVTFPLLAGARVQTLKSAAARMSGRGGQRPAVSVVRLPRAKLPRAGLPRSIFPGTRKANFDPSEPRVPIGNPHGGEWTRVIGPVAVVQRPKPIRLAGPLPQDDPPKIPEEKPPALRERDAGLPPQDEPPKIPQEKPPTSSERNAIIRRAAAWIAQAALGRAPPLVQAFVGVLRAVDWLKDAVPAVLSAGDPPKSLEELRAAVGTPRLGYQVHHIVEQTPAAQDGFPRSRIDHRDNLALVPTLKHYAITGWYMEKNADLGGVSPREYLRGRSWEDRTEIGLRAMIEKGVLKP